MGGESRYAQGTGGVTTLGGTTDNGADSVSQGRRRVVVTLGRGGNGSRRAPPHKGIHKETAGNYIKKGVLLPNLWDLYVGGADAGDDLDGAMVGLGRGKQT